MNIPVQKNKEYIVKIVDNGFEGEGIAKIEGYTIFIPNAIKGEKVKVLILKVLTSHAFGKVIEIIQKSPYRKDSDCGTYKRCGGCNLRHIQYQKTLEIKQNAVQSLVNKTLKTKIKVEKVVEMKQPYYYRNKAQYPVGIDKNGKPIIGIFANRTHEIIEMQDCKIQNPESEKIAKYIFNLWNKEKLSIYQEKTRKGLLRHIVIKIGVKTKEIMCILVINGKEIPNENILEKEYSALDLIKKRFKYERINKINADELDNFINIIKDTNRIRNNLKEYIKNELTELTEMEKRTSCNNILENVLVFCKYEKLELDVAKQVLDIIKYAINDLERNIELQRTAQLLQRINEQSQKIELEDKNLEEEIKDSFSYLKIKLEMSNNGNLTPNAFFNRLQKSLKSGSKIERNEELMGYQTIKDELNINKK